MNKLSIGILALLVALGVGAYVLTPGDVDQGGPKGAVSSPDIPSPYFSFGDVKFWATKANMGTASTTVCAIANPVGGNAATSSIESITFQIDTGTTTAAAITIATSTSPYATSTSDELIADYAVASGAKATVVWNPSGANNSLIGPGQYIIVKTAGAGLGGYTYGGTCQAKFQDVSN